jgi:hypothetical protein
MVTATITAVGCPPRVQPVLLQVAFDFIISEAINLHQLPNLLGSCSCINNKKTLSKFQRTNQKINQTILLGAINNVTTNYHSII